MSDKIQKVLEILESKNLIDKRGFSITNTLISSYIEEYAKLSGNGKKFSLRLAQKIACMNLVEFKLLHKIQGDEGFAYVISNPAWPDHFKVGMSKQVKKRLASYQTYSPFRDYKLEWFGFWQDMRKGEIALRSCFEVESHEWVLRDNIDKFKHLADIY